MLVSGDEEYRSEEGLPQLGRILTKHHGFRCTVLFAINPEDGTIDPDNTRNLPFHAGFAVAYAGRNLGVPVTVAVPESTPEEVRLRIRQEGAEVLVAAVGEEVKGMLCTKNHRI